MVFFSTRISTLCHLFAVKYYLFCIFYNNVFCSSVSHVQLFETPWTVACQASLSFTISWSSFKLMFTGSDNNVSDYLFIGISAVFQ